MEYLKLFWKHNLDDESVVILYEINKSNERLAIGLLIFLQIEIRQILVIFMR